MKKEQRERLNLLPILKQSDDIIPLGFNPKKVKGGDEASLKSGSISQTIFEIAKSNMEKDFLRRWWCKHYNLPPTDERLEKYTVEELAIEYTEYAIENDLFILDENGNPARFTEKNGVTIYETNDPKWKEFEEKLASSPTFDELMAQLGDEKKDEEDDDESFSFNRG